MNINGYTVFTLTNIKINDQQAKDVNLILAHSAYIYDDYIILFTKLNLSKKIEKHNLRWSREHQTIFFQRQDKTTRKNYTP